MDATGAFYTVMGEPLLSVYSSFEQVAESEDEPDSEPMGAQI